MMWHYFVPLLVNQLQVAVHHVQEFVMEVRMEHKIPPPSPKSSVAISLAKVTITKLHAHVAKLAAHYPLQSCSIANRQ